MKRSRPVTEADIARAEQGLEATNGILEIKRENLQALEEKMAEVVCAPSLHLEEITYE